MKFIRFAFFFFVTGTTYANAQMVPKTVVLEHFTNSRCGICANRNPALFQNLRNHPQVMHLSIHPSSPYANCFLSQRNQVANDARTNYYSIFGGTPRIVINGTVQAPGVNFGGTTLFDAFFQDSTSFVVDARVAWRGADSIVYSMVITKVASSSLLTATLFTGLSQDTVFGNGGNGEQAHYRVVVSTASSTINLPVLVNDSVVFTQVVSLQGVWTPNRLAAFAILQDIPQKALLQAAKSAQLEAPISSSLKLTNVSNLSQLFPNPTNGVLRTAEATSFYFEVYNLLGVLQQMGEAPAGEFTLKADLRAGTYFVKILNDQGQQHTQKVILNH